ncbi:tetratricopeptide repeat protein, partial [Streptomyces nigra]
DAGRIQEALDLGERVLADRQRLLGDDHPDTLTARNNLANFYRDAGRVQEALDLGERVLGDDHPDTLDARNNLARARDDAAAVQRLDAATPATTADVRPPSDAPE